MKKAAEGPQRPRTIARRLASQPSEHTRRTAINTLIFSVATGLSRVAGLIREVVAAAYFGTSGAAGAFTLAFQIPNLIRALVADAALSSAFVPVFSELLEQKKRKEAIELAGALAGLMLVALTVISLVFILIAPWLIPLFTGDEFTPALDTLAVGLSQVLFPIVVLLGLTGLVVGILNVHDHFAIPAIAPLVWNIVIIAGMVGLAPLFEGDDQLYAYAIGVVAGTLVQLLMMLPTLRRMGFPLSHIRLPRRGDERVKRVLMLMLPVSVGLGLININLLLNTVIALRRLRRGAARDRRRVPHLHAPAGDVQRRGGDRAVPAARPAGGAQRLRRAARHDRHRPAPDRAAADPRRRGDGGARRPDRAARLRARRVGRRSRPRSPPTRCSGSRSASRSAASS